MKYLSRMWLILAILLSTASTRAQEVTDHDLDLAISTIQALQEAIQKSYLTLSQTGNATLAQQDAIKVLSQFHLYNEEERLSRGLKVRNIGLRVTAGSVFFLAASWIADKSSAQIAESFLGQVIKRSANPKTIAAMILKPGSRMTIFQYLLNPQFNSESAKPILAAFENVPEMRDGVLEFERKYFLTNNRRIINPRDAVKNSRISSSHDIAANLDHELATGHYQVSIRKAFVEEFGSDVVSMAKTSKLPGTVFVERMTMQEILHSTANVLAVSGLAVVLAGTVYQIFLDTHDSVQPMTEKDVLLYDYNQIRDYLSDSDHSALTLALAKEAQSLKITVPENLE